MQFVVTTSPTAKLVAAKVSNANEFVSDARVIPNPNNGNSIFQYRLNEKSVVNIELFNSNGILVKKILSSTIQNAGAQIQNVKLNDCPSGIYFIKISSEKQSRMLKFIINK
jgi:hypothetical protein